MKLRNCILLLIVAILSNCESKTAETSSTTPATTETATSASADTAAVVTAPPEPDRDGAGKPDTKNAGSDNNENDTRIDSSTSGYSQQAETVINKEKLNNLKVKLKKVNLSKAQAENTQQQLKNLRTNTKKTVEVFFATDRQQVDSSTAKNTFGVARGPVKYGICIVNIPPQHSIGILESPSLLKLEFRNDPKKHIFVAKTKIINASNFFTQVKQGVKETKRKSAFIFVHGYNVSFNDAARRTAQIACDTNFDGIPLFFSWPSQATLQGYLADETNIDWAQRHLEGFLKDFMEKSDAENVYCIAHSMGNRGLTRALTSLLQKNPTYAPRIKELILAAPDIDQEVFVQDIAPMITAKLPPITMYVSSKDKAIIASKIAHKYRRAGEGGRDLLVTNGVETIDASAIDMSFLGHGYLAEERPVIEDLSWLIMHDDRAAQRQMLKLSPSGTYWLLRK